MLPQDDDDGDEMCWISETLWRRRNDAFSGNRFNSGFNIIQFFHLTQISPDFSKQSDDDQYDDVDEKGDHDDNINEEKDNGDNDYLMTATRWWNFSIVQNFLLDPNLARLLKTTSVDWWIWFERWWLWQYRKQNHDDDKDI